MAIDQTGRQLDLCLAARWLRCVLYGRPIYVVKDGRAHIREIQLLRRSGRFAAITSGLNQGEAVIVYPSDRVAPGVRVGPRKVGDSAGGS
jgi:hypothetical protein